MSDNMQRASLGSAEPPASANPELAQPSPALTVVPTESAKPTPSAEPEPVSIEKPKGGGLDRFKSTNLEPEKVEALPTVLPVHKISEAKDWTRLCPDPAYWSYELFFVNVPISGQKRDTLHLITPQLATLLPPGRVLKFRLALASKPHDNFFLAQVPSQNLDNDWNKTNLQACEQATKFWTTATSQKAQGIEGYKIEMSAAERKGKKPFPEPNWPTKSTLEELIEATFAGRMIESETDPAWLRLVGDC
jgi:hypothetical protein